MTLSAEFPAAALIPADPSNYHAAKRQPADIDHVIIHITDGQPLAAKAAKRVQTPGLGASAHFFVGQSGEIVQAVLIKDVAYHAHEANRLSIGIEHCARTPRELGPDDLGLPVSDLQLAASARLVAWLLMRCGLAPKRLETVVGHCEIDKKTTHADCPNAIWPWDRYMEMVTAEYDSLQISPR